MKLIQQQIDNLKTIDIPLSKKDNFDSFWADAVEKVNNHNPEPNMTLLDDYPLNGVDVYDTIFHGLDGTPVKSWVILPEKAKKEPVPAVVWFHGGGGSRHRPFQHNHWVAAGYAVIAMDFRQQGGQTGSNTPLKRCGGNSFALMNIEDYKSYYLYHAWTDALLSVKLTEKIPEIDQNRVAVGGGSQGGGTALTMASLNHNISICLAAVPSFCWWERRIQIRSACAADISGYIAKNPDSLENVYNTMSYYDVTNFVDKIKCPVMASCGFQDQATPPDCIYAAYNKITSEKYINNYPAGGHVLEQKETENWLRFLRERL
jgi:cephalosporin-C deacetylase